MMNLVYVPLSKIRQVWPMVHKMVRNGVGQDNRRMNVPAIKKMTLDGHWHMWVVWNEDNKIVKAVFFTEIYEEISGLKMGTIRFFSGEDRREWVQLLDTLEEHMRNAGVQRMEIWARRGWLRELPNYKLTHVLLEKDLDDGLRKVEDNGSNQRPTVGNTERERDPGRAERPVRSGDTGDRIPAAASGSA